LILARYGVGDELRTMITDDRGAAPLSGTGRRCTCTTTSTKRSMSSKANSRSSAARSHHAGPGAFAFLPCGIAHGFRVVGEAPLRMLTFGVPGGQEDFFRDAGRPAEDLGLPPEADLDIAMLKEVAARHNHEIVGPPIDRAKQSEKQHLHKRRPPPRPLDPPDAESKPRTLSTD
jgi:hypothetical protein